MTEMTYVVENLDFEPYKPKKRNSLYYSLLPIFLSIFIYILCFYVIDVSSPSWIFNDTKILFVISNALIIIIAADYGAFTDKESHDFYGEYTAAMRNDAKEDPRPENAGYGVSSLGEDFRNRSEKQEEAVGAKDIEHRYYLPNKEANVPERTIQVVSKNVQPRNVAIEKYKPVLPNQNIHITAAKEETCNARDLLNPKPYGRSKSDKARGRVSMITKERLHQEIRHRPKSYDRSQSDSSKWMVVHKAEKKAEEMEEATEKWENVREESEEFSKMTNEELNRRVEDFIQRFNRDIKRQSFGLV
ncbi:hypothetical protein CARUB_v10025195mg [Capsella rubella]|uniref:DUF4408 domain-containing protein n=1 Tax=Capsella rubella TaxID=81985 RepID=R0HU61_9BRAS|nr:uncharacterized protein LOC17889382 [Capsella rubella]EOA28945.1 hypothetical protein CARUB_v10025195mg [Capsella rubella]